MRSRTSILVTLAALGLTACATLPLESTEPTDDQESAATFVGGTALMANPASVCWVLRSGSPVTQAEIDSIQSVISEWSHGDTSLRYNFASALTTFTNMNVGGTIYRTNCTRNAAGVFQETLRLYVDDNPYPDKATPYPAALTVPGCSVDEGIGTQAKNPNGTPMKHGNLFVASVYLWSSFPQSLIDDTRCLYTTHLLRGQPRNNYLHELGHSLGLSHEQDRVDDTCVPVASEGAAQLKVTAYDRDSVMHYVMTCTDGSKTIGNFGSNGLSPSDKLAAEILYPVGSDARIDGHLVGWVGGGNLDPVSDWLNRGAFPATRDGVLSGFRWSVDGALVSTRTQPTSSELAGIGVGRHTLRLEYTDAWHRAYAGQVVVDQLASQAAYAARVGAIVTPVLM